MSTPPLKRRLRRYWQKSGPARYLKNRRNRILDRLCEGNIFRVHKEPFSILEVGCNRGKDLIKFLDGRNDLKIYGIDVQDLNIRQENFEFINADAEQMDFPDKHFDLVISFGMMEHIEPIEKLSRILKEIDRVAKSYLIVVPSIDTPFEPHVGRFFWQLRSHNKKKAFRKLNYYSDEAWLQFEGFSGAKVKRFYYIPMLVKNLVIYKNGN